MSNPSNAMSETPFAPDAAAAAALSATRPFYWSVRRELWENRSVYLAPLAVAGVVLVGFLFSTIGMPQRRLATLKLPLARQAAVIAEPYDFAAGAIIMTMVIVAIFYSLNALHAERRDRSLLFWKSLPVSDATTVLSKAFVPLAVVPAVAFVIATATQLVILLASVVILLSNGVPATAPGGPDLAAQWVMELYGLVALTLWSAPLCGWLLLVSAWARRTPFLWAFLPPLALCLFEFLAFHTHKLWSALQYRLVGGLGEAFTVGGQAKVVISHPSQLEPLRFLSLPGLWAGLVIAAACLAACVWLRRRNDPI
ncbi:MAG: hypothetical protein JWP23_1348 [Phenylobacterium sp.]|nr:hypothetical protein [Phenylobacterium sp.]